MASLQKYVFSEDSHTRKRTLTAVHTKVSNLVCEDHPAHDSRWEVFGQRFEYDVLHERAEVSKTNGRKARKPGIRERRAKRGETRHAPFLSILREGDREMHEMVDRNVVDEDTDVGQSGFVEAS